MQYLILASLVAAALSLACSRSAADQPLPARSATEDARVRRCPASAQAGDDALARAAACAEAFVARNGYTATAPAGPAELAYESIEVGGTPRQVLAGRRGTLGARAFAVCHGAGTGAAGYTVVFTAPGDTTPRSGVAVVMDSAFSQLTVMHQPLVLGAVVLPPACSARSAGLSRAAG